MKVNAKYVEDVKFEGHGTEKGVKVEFECLGLEVTHPYNGIGVIVEEGRFGISERDGGIEIVKNGKLVWSSVHGACGG